MLVVTRRLRPLGLAMGLSLAMLGGLQAQEDKVVATVNGQQITEQDLKAAVTDLDPQLARLPAEQQRAAALSALIELRLMAGEAGARGLDKNPEFQRRLAMLNQRALHAEVIDQEVAKKITDEEVRARYDQEIAATPAENEVKARHILVKTKEEAEAIIKELDGGGDFEKIANEKTEDPSGKTSGGDLGYFGAGQMVPEFEKAAFALEPGSYTREPVQSQFGWHVIKVEDKRAKQPPAFDEVKDQFRNVVLREKYYALVKQLRDAATVDIADADLKKALEPAAEGAGEKPAEQPQQ
ncbi:MAG: peptidylprolyl isomerase [Rhizobiaceae bacterium]|nr:peptidylprolyl isomerase [Rhizobiaceae bacterium]